MAAAFSEQAFEQKLVNLKDTQEAINALSQWCLQNRSHHKKIVTCWLHCLKRVKVDQRLSLFYLANDVIQYSKRKHLDFVESWGTALQKATPLVRDDKVRSRVMRIFKIWEERGVYDEAFISDLCGLLTTNVKKKEVEASSDPADFQPAALVKKIRECKMLEENTDTRHRRVKDFKLPLTDAESMRMSLKDRRHGSDIAAEVDSGVKKMEAYVKALESENSSREKLIEMLRQAMVFYETQRGEAKIVANAYRNFGNRLKTNQKALEELLPTLMSPLPSPDVDAPSPSPDDELEGNSLGNSFEPQPPISNGNDIDFSFTSSFIGSAQFLDLQKEFSMVNVPQIGDHSTNNQDGGQTIEVISSRSEPEESFNASAFLKSLMPNKETTALPPPPMPPVFGDWSSGVPWSDPPPDTPQSPPLYEKQVPVVQPIEYDDSLPVPPIPDIDHRALLPLLSSVVSAHEVPISAVDTDQRIPPSVPVVHEPPPQMGIDMDHRVLALDRTMEYPPALVMEPHPRMDVPPPLIDHLQGLEPIRMDHPPPMRLDQPSMRLDPPSMRMEPPPMRMEPRLMAPRMEPPPMRLELPPNPLNLLDHITHQLNIGRIPALNTDRGAILTAPKKDSPLKLSADVDRRNLISLTGSPSVNSPVMPQKPGGFGWGHQDRRELDPRFPKDDVESVDMDVSEEDEEESQARNAGVDGERRLYGTPGAKKPTPVRELVNIEVGARLQGPPRQEPPNYTEPDYSAEVGVFTEPEISEIQCVGAKLIPPVEHTPERNGPGHGPMLHPHPNFSPGFIPRPRSDFSPRPRWRHPRPNFPYRTPPPFRGHFRPRGRW